MKQSNGKTTMNALLNVIGILQKKFFREYNIKFKPFKDIEFKPARDARDVKRKKHLLIIFSSQIQLVVRLRIDIFLQILTHLNPNLWKIQLVLRTRCIFVVGIQIR